MNLYKLILLPIGAGIFASAVSGCASSGPMHSAKSSSPIAISYNCEPDMDSNWVPESTPPHVLAAQAQPWVVTTSEVGDITVTYYRDCGNEVRGPVSAKYPIGPLLGSTFCNGGKQVDVFGYPDPKDIGDTLAVHAAEILKILADSKDCVSKQVMPIG